MGLLKAFQSMLAVVGGVTVVVIPLIVFMWVRYPNNLEVIVSQVARVFSFLGDHVKRSQIKHVLQGKLNKEIVELEREVEGAAPNGISIEWIGKDANRESFLQGDTVVCRMSYDRNPHINFLNAALLYVRSGLVPEARNYMDTSIRQATDCAAVDLILAKAGNRGAQRVFKDEILPGQLRDKIEMRIAYADFTNMEQVAGTFSRIFLPELVAYGTKLQGLPPNAATYAEIEDLIRFLNQLADNASRRRVANLDHHSNNISIGVAYVGIRAKITHEGAAPYLKAIEIHREQGPKSLYLCAREDSRMALSAVSRLAEQRGLCTILAEKRFTVMLAGEVLHACIVRARV